MYKIVYLLFVELWRIFIMRYNSYKLWNFLLYDTDRENGFTSKMPEESSRLLTRIYPHEKYKWYTCELGCILIHSGETGSRRRPYFAALSHRWDVFILLYANLFLVSQKGMYLSMTCTFTIIRFNTSVLYGEVGINIRINNKRPSFRIWLVCPS